MPYSVPSSPIDSARPALHGRNHSHSHSRPTFSSEKGQGTFSSLGVLPRRKSASKVALRSVVVSPTSTDASSMPHTPTSPVWNSAVRLTPAGYPGALGLSLPPSPSRKFHFQEDADDSPEDDAAVLSPGIKLKRSLGNTFRLKLNTDNLSVSPYQSPMNSPRGSPRTSPPIAVLSSVAEGEATAVPFPRLSGTPVEPFSSNVSHVRSASSPRPSFTRTPSHPIILSNGRPLKSSLKGSSSSPSFPHHLGLPEDAKHHPNQFPHGHHRHHHHQHHGKDGKGIRSHHLRAQSAPSTPSLSSDGGEEWPDASPLGTPSTPKSVHFPEKDGLEDVRLFKSRAKPAAVSRAEAEDTETETEGEGLPGTRSWSGRHFAGSFPFPRISPASASSGTFVPGAFELDTTRTSVVPAPNLPQYANIHLESLTMAENMSAPTLNGILLVRNIVFEKHVAVRFTLDDWQTTSEVLAKHVASLTSFPLAQPGNDTFVGDLVSQSAWDRFSFVIRLEDYTQKLHERTLWIVSRFSSLSGEWWDNNSGQNYRVGFKQKQKPAETPKRAPTLSLPANITRISAPPPPASGKIPPAPGLATPTAHASIQRLSKFSLSNYAAPKSRSPSLSPSTSRVHIPTPPVVDNTILTPPATPSDSEEEEEGAPRPAVGVVWTASNSGETTPRAEKSRFHISSSDTEVPRRGSSASSDVESPRTWSDTEPRGGRKLSLRSSMPKIVLPPPSEDPWSSKRTFVTSPNRYPAASSISVMLTEAASSSPKPSAGEGENLYDAFVKQWCFAQSPPPTPSALLPGGVLV